MAAVVARAVVNRNWLRYVVVVTLLAIVVVGVLSQLSILTMLARDASHVPMEHGPVAQKNDSSESEVHVDDDEDVVAKEGKSEGDDEDEEEAGDQDDKDVESANQFFAEKFTEVADNDEGENDGKDDDDDDDDDVEEEEEEVSQLETARSDVWATRTEEEMVAFARKPASLSDPLLPYAPWPADTKEEERLNLVIVLTQGRMGSSLVGSLFDADKRNFYLFEPFVKKHPTDKRHQPRLFRVDDVLLCRFLVHKKPVSSGLQCARSLHCRVQYAKYYQKKTTHAIPYLGETRTKCAAKRRRIMKVIRIPSLQPIVEQLILPPELRHARVRVIHLVRDPRAVLHSRLHTPEFTPQKETDWKRTRQVSRELCDVLQQQSRAQDVQRILQGGNHNATAAPHFHGYLRLRYEDFVDKPLKWSERLYQFAFNEAPPPSVTASILETNRKHQAKKKRGARTYDAYDLAGSGHGFDLKQTSIDIVEDSCREAMVELGYLAS